MKKLILATAFSALTLPVYAENSVPVNSEPSPATYSGSAVNGRISSLGLGVEGVFPVTPTVDTRIGINAFKYNFSKTTAASPGVVGTNYRGNYDLQSLQVLADWHPWASSFRVTGGLVYNNNKFNMTALPDASNFVWIGGQKYALLSIIGTQAYATSTVEFRKVAPYLGIGWGKTPKNSGLTFTSDIGILFQGSANSTITTNINGIAPADLAQANADIKDSLKNFNLYPVVSIGLGYSF